MDVPAEAALIAAFVNTRDVETGSDLLATRTALTEWVTTQVGPVDGQASATDLRRAHELREALRDVLIAHHDDTDHDTGDDSEVAPTAFDRAVAGYPLRLVCAAGEPRLVAAGAGVSAGVGSIVAAVAASVAAGSWARLKVCAADTCLWAFYDTSKNHSRSWCSMSVCGNRAKTRTFRSRQRTPGTGADAD